MKIGIATFGCDAGRSGIGQYLIHMVRGFVAAQPHHEYELLVSRGDIDTFAVPHDSLTQICFSERMARPLRNIVWHQVTLPQLCRQRNHDVLFMPAANRRLPFWAPCPVVGTVHDLAPVHVAGKYDGWRQTYVRRVLPWLIRRLHRVVTVSEASKRDVVHYAKVPAERVHVIPNGVDHQAFHRLTPPQTATVRARFGLDRPYLLYVSRLEHPGKNHVRLIEAFERFKLAHGGQHILVLAGPDKERAEEVHQAAAQSPCAGDIKFTGFVSDADLPALYAGAAGFIMPSLFEGFGIPVIEAMACGVPVACSNVASLPEVAGNAGVLFDPCDPSDIARGISRILLDETTRRECIERGLARSQRYSWQQAARETLTVLEQAAHETVEVGRRAVVHA
jgi:glycosyltransferase involved in cell wall biosynthesis